MNKDNFFNDVVGKIFVNLYTLTKRDKDMVVSNFNLDDEEDRLFLLNCLSASTIYKRPMKVRMNPIKFLWLKHKKEPIIKHAKWTFKKPNVNIGEMKKFMSLVFKNTNYSYKDIYNEFYKEGDC